jgi:hypothetical protein
VSWYLVGNDVTAGRLHTTVGTCVRTEIIASKECKEMKLRKAVSKEYHTDVSALLTALVPIFPEILHLEPCAELYCSLCTINSNKHATREGFRRCSVRCRLVVESTLIKSPAEPSAAKTISDRKEIAVILLQPVRMQDHAAKHVLNSIYGARL